MQIVMLNQQLQCGILFFLGQLRTFSFTMKGVKTHRRTESSFILESARTSPLALRWVNSEMCVSFSTLTPGSHHNFQNEFTPH